MNLQTSWERKDGRITHYIHLNYLQVVVGSHAGSGHTDNASACGYDAFVDGRFHSHILTYFDEGVLTAVLAAVQAAQTYPPFIAKRNKTAVAHAFLEETGFVHRLLFHPDGTHLASLLGGEVHWWDVETQERKAIFQVSL